jgi:hypothetical protein
MLLTIKPIQELCETETIDTASWCGFRFFTDLLEIRPPKITGVTIKDTGMENCLSKTKFTSVERCPGTQAQQE